MIVAGWALFGLGVVHLVFGVLRFRTPLAEAWADHIARLHIDGLVLSPPRSSAGLHQMVALHPHLDASEVAHRLASIGIAVDTTSDN